MGHLFSRAIKRITQGAQSTRAAQQPAPASQPNDSDKADQSRGQQSGQVRSSVGLSETIPVGQSIDSAEYAALEEANKQQQQPIAAAQATTKIVTTPKEQQNVEEAVIKIQALVRGHLTRKALRLDAQNQQSPNLPPAALGQSQFDEASLMSNPPAAVFLASSPLGNGVVVSQPQQAADVQQPRTPLESIAEVIETTNAPTGRNGNENGDSKTLFATLGKRSIPSPSKLEMPTDLTRDSASPATPSEAVASIDLNYDTPASASIDIVGHHIKPTSEMIASILHHKLTEEEENRERQQQQQQQQQQQSQLQSIDELTMSNYNNSNHTNNTGRTNSANTPDSLESEEAAAIRIQSAFRGYRTRKNSPYRTRSPNQASSAGTTNSFRQTNSQPAPTTTPTEVLIEGDNNERPLPAQPAHPANGATEHQRVGMSADDEDENGATRLVTTVEGEQQIPAINGEGDQPLGRRESRSLKRGDSGQSNDSNSNLNDTLRSLHTAESTGEQQLAVDASSLQAELDSSACEMMEVPQSAGGALELDSAASTLDNLSGRSLAPRISLATGNSLDTDSSVLGAVISLNDTIATDGGGCQPAAMIHGQAEALDDELESVGRLVEEMEEEDVGAEQVAQVAVDDKSESALDEATNQLEAALEEASAEEPKGELGKTNDDAIGVEAQQALIDELESDDIERRDPQGQHRAPEIRRSEVQFVESLVEQPCRDDETDKRVSFVQQTELVAPNSGRSSPAFNSSADGNSISSAEEGDAANSSDEAAAAAESKQAPGVARDNNAQKQHQLQQQSAKQAGNKRRNNRNKRKGKK